ncbi:MAG: Tfp pilus assembly protein, major pilin PilA [Candidatus Nomurabacteria bacterium GW2011_GWA1_40_8]|nr:MAG: Tfp pilus assembly protein, major pilin PilA [Candidatus Nomurabacteria bacterium GW2011_GWA1_40_8]
MKNFYQKGITIIELLIVIVVIGIMALIVLPQFSYIKENQVLKNGVSDILSSIDSPATISAITLGGGGSDIYFNRLSGSPSVTGTVTLSTTNYSKIITISATGVGSSN